MLRYSQIMMLYRVMGYGHDTGSLEPQGEYIFFRAAYREASAVAGFVERIADHAVWIPWQGWSDPNTLAQLNPQS